MPYTIKRFRHTVVKNVLEFCQRIRKTAWSEAVVLVSLARVELAPLAPGASTLSIELQGQDGVDFTMIKMSWMKF